MGRLTGFEPATSGTTNRRSNQLSYNRHNLCREGGYVGNRAGRSSRIGTGERLLHKARAVQSENCVARDTAQ
jgi:hypothetical protein